MGNNPISNVDPTGGVVNPVVDSDGNFLGFDEFGAGGEAIVYDGAFSEGMSQAAILDGGGLFASDFFTANNFTLGQAMDFQALANQSFKDYINTTALIATGELIQDVSFGLSFMTGTGSASAARTSTGLTARGVGQAQLNFSVKAAEHMANSGRAVPVQILRQAIQGSKGVADPRGSRALMHTAEMMKNGKLYKLEVLYDKVTNAVWHFHYSPIK